MDSSSRPIRALASGEIETTLGHFGRQALREAPRAWVRARMGYDPVLFVTQREDKFFVDFGDRDVVLVASYEPVEDRFLFMPYDRRWPGMVAGGET